MSLVTLHVYDITNTQYETANAAIQGLNRFTKDTLGAGGIFHGAVEVNGDEWSYGYCDRGTGVYCCRPRGNSGYTYRESIPLGVTSLSPARVRSVVAVLQVQWAGESYDLLGRNCNHFCETFGEMLGVGPIPGWVNRFATNADATVTAVTYARDQIRVVGEEIGLAATAATNWLISGFTATEPSAGAGPHNGGGGGGVGAGGGGGGWDEKSRGDFGGGGDEVEGGVGVGGDHVEGGVGGLGADRGSAPPPGAEVDDLDDDGATTTENSTPRSSTARDAAGGEVTQIAAAVEVYT